MFLLAAWSLNAGWDLTSVTIYGFFAAIAPVITGFRLMNLHMTKSPAVA